MVTAGAALTSIRFFTAIYKNSRKKKPKTKLQHDFFSYTPVWKKPFLTTVFTVCFYAEARNFNSLTKAITLNITYFLEM